MLILPLKFVREEDKKAVGSNIYHLAKLSHLGLPVVESVVAIPPTPIFEKVVNKYIKHNMSIHDHINNIKKEMQSLPIPESLKSFEMVNASLKQAKITLDVNKLWQNLLEKWTYEIMSKIERKDNNLFNLTPQLIIFSANYTAFGKGYYDEDREHAVIKLDKGEISFQTSSEIENLILLGNKKLLLPQIYYWGIEDGKIKIVKIAPFTQSLHENIEDTEKVVTAQNNTRPTALTATKIFLDYQGEPVTKYNSDGTILNITKNDHDEINNQIAKITKFDSSAKFIFFPDQEPTLEKSLEYAKTFLFFRNKQKLEVQIVLPQTFSVEEFLDLKREFASLGIYSKGSLKIWKQFNTFADFLNMDEYIDGGFDGAVIDLDRISEMVCGIDGETILKSGRKDWLDAIEKFFKKIEFSKLIKSNKLVLLRGRLCQNEELLNYFINSGVWAFAFDVGTAANFREHIAFLEKQAVKKLSRIEIQH